MSAVTSLMLTSSFLMLMTGFLMLSHHIHEICIADVSSEKEEPAPVFEAGSAVAFGQALSGVVLILVL